MEGEVKEIQMELAAIKRDRLDLYNRRQKLLGEETDNIILKDSGTYESFIRSQEDKCGENFSEMSKIQEESIKAKCTAEEERFQNYEKKLRDLEQKINNICCGGKPIDVKTSTNMSATSSGTEEVSNLKTHIKDLKEEIDELKLTITEKDELIQEYRVKFIQSQQLVHDLRRQLDAIEYENKQVTDQIHVEIQKIKMQFQEKLHELAPLPDLLKGAQIQLQEAKQMQNLAEEGTQQLSIELYRVKEKLLTAVQNLNKEKADKAELAEEYEVLKQHLHDKQKEMDEAIKLIDEYKSEEKRLAEKLLDQENKLKDKLMEYAKLWEEFEQFKTESSRSLNRCKERSDATRRDLHTQISELESQLIQSRAHLRACQKERNEMRQKLIMQINNLQENFKLVEMRIHGLQNQVSSLKTSYTVILAKENAEGTETAKKLTTN